MSSMSNYRSRCGNCGFVFATVTHRKRCPECKSFGWITTYKIYTLEDCPLCSDLMGGTTQHSEDDENCPLCDSVIAIVNESIVHTNSGAKVDVASYHQLMVDIIARKENEEEF